MLFSFLTLAVIQMEITFLWRIGTYGMNIIISQLSGGSVSLKDWYEYELNNQWAFISKRSNHYCFLFFYCWFLLIIFFFLPLNEEMDNSLMRHFVEFLIMVFSNTPCQPNWLSHSITRNRMSYSHWLKAVMH